MNKGLFAVTCLLSTILLLACGCAKPEPAPAPLAAGPMEPLPPASPLREASEKATTTPQMAGVQKMMAEPKPAPRGEGGEFVTGADVLGKPADAPAKSAAAKPARLAERAGKTAAVSAKASARSVGAKPAAAKLAARRAATVVAKANPKADAKSSHVGHGSVVAKAGPAGSGTLTVDPDGSKPNASYAVTASTYFEKVVQGGKFGKDLHLRGSWADVASGKRVWFTFAAAANKTAKPALASVATFVRPRTKEEYARYEKQLSLRHTGTSNKT